MALQAGVDAGERRRHAVDPTEWNRNDGFSPGPAILVHGPGHRPRQTGAAPLTDIGRSLDADAPIVLLDADTGERRPFFAELDANIPAADRPTDQLLFIRPAAELHRGSPLHRRAPRPAGRRRAR